MNQRKITATLAWMLFRTGLQSRRVGARRWGFDASGYLRFDQYQSGQVAVLRGAACFVPGAPLVVTFSI